MKTMQKAASAALALSLILALAACGAKKEETPADPPAQTTKKYLIGINQYGEHASLDNCRIGFLQGLEEAGLAEGTDFEVDYQNAGFDDAVDAQIAQGFSAEDVDLMVGIATPSAIACFNAAEDKNIPVIFTAITDPVQANLDSGNVTGTSDKLPVEAQLDLIRQLQPNAKAIGIIYTTSEPNSVSAIAEYQEKAGEYGFTIDAIGVTAQSEVTQAADTLIAHDVDAISNLTDNNVVGVLAAILEKTNEAGIPVYGSEIEQMKNNVKDLTSQISQLEKEKKSAPTSEQLSYTVQIQALEADKKEAEYNITVKQKELDSMTSGSGTANVTAPVDGKVQAINENGTDSSGNAAAYITLVQDGAYRVKGKINELNRSDIAVGVSVVIRSRVDDSVWSGTITEIDTENPSSGNGGMSYGYGNSNSDDTSSSSNYPFYVELNSTDGLMLGQHVYIEPSDGGTVSDTMKLDASFLQGSAEEGFWVWAEKDGKLEKRTVTVGTFDETYNTYEILDGLAAEDYIAFPEDGMEEGDPTTHTMPTEDPSAEPSDGVDDSGMIDNGGIDDGYVDSGAIGDSADTGLIEGGEEESAGSEDGESSQTGGVTYAR